MMRSALRAMALSILPVVAAGSADADRDHGHRVAISRAADPRFFHPFFHPFFFRSTVFFVPPPVAFYAPPVYYVPPPIYPYAPPLPAAAAPPPDSPGSAAECRAYRSTITIDGRPQLLVGTLCKGPDGNWHLVP